MKEDPAQREIVDRILGSIKDQYGSVPVVNQVLSERPDMFIPSVEFNRAVLEDRDGAIKRKERYLCAISAAAAVGGEHCLRVQISHAKDAGASRDEILESIMIGCTMSMTRSQSYALRAYAEAFDIRYERSEDNAFSNQRGLGERFKWSRSHPMRRSSSWTSSRRIRRPDTASRST